MLIFIFPFSESYFRLSPSYSPIIAVGLLAKASRIESSRNPFLFSPCPSCKTYSSLKYCFDLTSSLRIKHWWFSLPTKHRSNFCAWFSRLFVFCLGWLIWSFLVVGLHSQGHGIKCCTESQLCAVTLLERAWLEACLSALHVWNVPWALLLYSHFISFQCLPPPFVYPDLVICKWLLSYSSLIMSFLITLVRNNFPFSAFR